MDLAFIQRLDDHRYDGPALVAKQGLYSLGYNCIDFYAADWASIFQLAGDESFIVAGYIWVVRAVIERLGRPPPPNIDYPDELLPLLGRAVTKSTLGEFLDSWAGEPQFLKPLEEHKAFTGILVKELRDLRRTYGLPRDLKIWCSEPIEWLSEYRVFVQQNEIIGCQHYKGNSLCFPDPDIIQCAVDRYTTAPKAYCADFGVSKNDGTLLVEVNDAHSAGSYGLDPLIYARWLECRWAELTGWSPKP